MQPCSREMQGINSLLNPSSQISLQDLQHQQQQNQSSSSQIHGGSAHFESGTAHDDFLEQMLSTLGQPSCSWADLSPSGVANANNSGKVPWDNNNTITLPINGSNNKPRDLSDEMAPSGHENVAFPSYDESVNLASKFRNHQISGGGGGSKSAVAAAAAMMLQQELLMSRGLAGGGSAGAGAGEAGLIPMPLSLSNCDFDRSQKDVVDGSSFKSPTPVSFIIFLVSDGSRCK